MAELILICDCGMRMRAPGAVPGRVGRCPSCGGRLRVPEELPTAAPKPPVVDPAEAADGYRLAPEPPATAFSPARSRSPGVRTRRRTPEAPRPEKRGGVADGLLPPLDRPETSWLASFLYPLRGSESLGLIAGLAVLSWIFFLLVPEYCLAMLGDAESMGAGVLGKLFVLICGVPVVVLSPFVLSYWLQYLGRVLVSSAMGETAPPRSPDRNFDGFLNGLSPWFIWLVLGLGLGLLPLAWYLSSPSPDGTNPWIVLVLAVVGFPYLLVALMMSFLHDDALAAKPWRVIGGFFSLGAPFWALAALIGAAIGLAVGSFAVALLVRRHAFWPYLLLGLVCSFLFQWTAIVVMRLLGTYYFHRKDVLRWHREHPRWGVAWRL
jgi:hypothetical protein